MCSVHVFAMCVHIVFSLRVFLTYSQYMCLLHVFAKFVPYMWSLHFLLHVFNTCVHFMYFLNVIPNFIIKYVL